MAQSARWSQTNQTLADRISARTPDREKTSRSSGGIKLDRCKASKSESDPSGTVSKLQPNMWPTPIDTNKKITQAATMLGVDRNNSHPFSSLTGSLEVKGVILQLPRLKLLFDGKNM